MRKRNLGQRERRGTRGLPVLRRADREEQSLLPFADAGRFVPRFIWFERRALFTVSRYVLLAAAGNQDREHGRPSRTGRGTTGDPRTAGFM